MDLFDWVVILALGVGVWALLTQRRAIHKLRSFAERGKRHADLGLTLALTRARDQVIEQARGVRGDRSGGVPIACHAPEGEDVFLWTLLGPKPTGRFIEVGAFDGVRHSVSYLFESVGWTGVLIEGVPELAEAARAARPGSHVVHAALSKRGSTGTTTFGVLRKGGEVKSDSSLAAASAGKRGLEAVEVPLRTMDDVLDEAGAGAGTGEPFDFALIDVEGGEADLLDGFDLSRWRVRVIVIEDLTGGADATVRGLLEGAGYERAARLGRNDVYVRTDEPELPERARMLASFF